MNNMGKLKKLLVVLTLALLALGLTACNSGIDLYEGSDGNNWYFEMHISIDKTLLQVLESPASAEVNPATRKKWTVEAWLLKYFETLVSPEALARDAKAEQLSTFADTKYTQYRFLLTVPKTGNMKDSVAVSTRREIKTNGFIRTINENREDRFNYWQNQFVDAYSRYILGQDKALKSDYNTEMGVILFGARTYYDNPTEKQKAELTYDDVQKSWYKVTLPPLREAFGAVDMATFGNFLLSDYWAGSRNLQSNYTKRYINNDGTILYLYQKTMGDGESTVISQYIRADPTGWYLTALFIGAATTLTIVLLCRYNKKKGSLKEEVKNSLPPNPFEGY